jgi:hypothetical protein
MSSQRSERSCIFIACDGFKAAVARDVDGYTGAADPRAVFSLVDFAWPCFDPDLARSLLEAWELALSYEYGCPECELLQKDIRSTRAQGKVQTKHRVTLNW